MGMCTGRLTVGEHDTVKDVRDAIRPGMMRAGLVRSLAYSLSKM